MAPPGLEDDIVVLSDEESSDDEDSSSGSEENDDDEDGEEDEGSEYSDSSDESLVERTAEEENSISCLRIHLLEFLNCCAEELLKSIDTELGTLYDALKTMLGIEDPLPFPEVQELRSDVKNVVQHALFFDVRRISGHRARRSGPGPRTGW